jgi:beta-phosphoglucomutase-like phosphatase (HAD superfamily)
MLFGPDESLLNFRFDTIVSADAFENLKPAPDIFLAASKNLGVDTNEVIYH